MQTVSTLSRRRVLRRLIWIYSVCRCLFYGTPGFNRLITARHDSYKFKILNIRKHTFGHVRPAKIQISLRSRAVWPESSLGAFWIANNVKCRHTDKDTDQTARMHRLIWVFVWRMCQKVCFLTLWQFVWWWPCIQRDYFLQNFQKS